MRPLIGIRGLIITVAIFDPNPFFSLRHDGSQHYRPAGGIADLVSAEFFLPSR